MPGRPWQDTGPLSRLLKRAPASEASATLMGRQVRPTMVGGLVGLACRHLVPAHVPFSVRHHGLIKVKLGGKAWLRTHYSHPEPETDLYSFLATTTFCCVFQPTHPPRPLHLTPPVVQVRVQVPYLPGSFIHCGRFRLRDNVRPPPW